MSLAFALMAAINGSTGSCATLSNGLSLPHQASPASARRPRKILTPQGWRRKGPPGTLLHKPIRNPVRQLVSGITSADVTHPRPILGEGIQYRELVTLFSHHHWRSLYLNG
jgi:hypothetical protein